MSAGFAFLDEAVPGIRWDAKYATWDNFTGRPVDGYRVNRVVGTGALADGLARARDEAAATGFGLLLWDGYRPQRAVDHFWRWAGEPDDGRTKERFYPRIERPQMFERGYVARCSGHSRGSTVDLTLFHLDTGELADMGGGHDLMDVVSHHDAPGVGPEVTALRNHLRDLMDVAGFDSYAQEWWHYTLRDEPYPATYFDVPLDSGAPRGLIAAAALGGGAVAA